MSRFVLVRLLLAAAIPLLLIPPGPLRAQEHGQHAHAEGEEAAQERFDRGVAKLHSFWFDSANEEFAAAAASDPGCAMAHWGTAMTFWGNPMARSAPTAENAAQAVAAVARAEALADAATPRERAYNEAVAAL